MIVLVDQGVSVTTKSVLIGVCVNRLGGFEVAEGVNSIVVSLSKTCTSDGVVSDCWAVAVEIAALSCSVREYQLAYNAKPAITKNTSNTPASSINGFDLEKYERLFGAGVVSPCEGNCKLTKVILS